MIGRLATATLVAVGLLASACQGGTEADELTTAEPLAALAALAAGKQVVRGFGVPAVAVRTGRRVTVVGTRRATLTAASTRTALTPDLDGDGLPEVAATSGRELERRLVVSRSRRGRDVVVGRAGWDIVDVVGLLGSRWLIVAVDPRDRTYLLGFAPGERRWTWRARLPGDEVDDVDVRGDRVRISVYVPTDNAASAVVDIEVRGDTARITGTARRATYVRTAASRIDPGWLLEEIRKPPDEAGTQAGRIELTRPDGERQTLTESDRNVPAPALLRAGSDCAVVLLQPPSGASRVMAVAADGRILVEQRLARKGVEDVAMVGRRLTIARREGRRALVRPLRIDARLGACG